MNKNYKGLKVFGGMYVLLYLDSILCTSGIFIILLVEKGAKIPVDEGAKQCNEEMKKLLFLPPTLKKVDYKYGRPVILIVDTSPTGI